jgi:uncharacterized protein (TIGR03643 family)
MRYIEEQHTEERAPKERPSKEHPTEIYPLERQTKGRLTEVEQSRVIEMAWEDRTPFEAIETLYGLPEKEVIKLMRQNLKHKTFKNWRARVSGRKTKHKILRPAGVERGYCPSQYKPKSANK